MAGVDLNEQYDRVASKVKSLDTYNQITQGAKIGRAHV